ncbi:MAG TPA: hypothetical protein VGH26_06945 [Gaiellaceae bacterium]
MRDRLELGSGSEEFLALGAEAALLVLEYRAERPHLAAAERDVTRVEATSQQQRRGRGDARRLPPALRLPRRAG